MPALPLDEQNGHVGLRRRQGPGFVEDSRLDDAALLVVDIQRVRQRIGIALGGQQFHTETASSDASSGIDPRSEHKAKMIRRAGRSHAGDLRQRGKAGTREQRQLPQTHLHQGPVDANKGHDIADRRQRHQIRKFAQIRLGNRVGRVPAASA